MSSRPANVVPLNETVPFANPLVSPTWDSADRDADHTLTSCVDRAARVSGTGLFNYAQPN